MKRRVLRFWTWLIVAIAGFTVLGDLASERLHNTDVLDAEVIAGILAALAGALAILFQRRIEFVQSLRSVWDLCLDAMAEIRVIYLRSSVSEEQYLEAYRKLSRAIDGMRSVYRNVGETPRHIGLYPFAMLHDIRVALENDYVAQIFGDAAKRSARMAEIEGQWPLFRVRYLAELETPEPDRYVIKNHQTDQRMRGMGGMAGLRSLWRK
ncbi:MAG: hypothetical protein HXY22_08850 [Alphaproteobacteria bacterium]|nr:hypothetical protein [Alphaproteobacteria bacterium]